MRQITLTLVILICSICSAVHAQVVYQKMNQAFAVEGIDSLELVLDGPVIYRKTPGSKLLIEINVEVENISPNIMMVLSRSPRYKLIPTQRGNILNLQFNKDRPNILVGSQSAVERITYKVYLPQNLW
jgi:hypothetical protein